MSLRLSRLFVLGLLLAGATSCNTVNLATDLEITEVQSGWFDAGAVARLWTEHQAGADHATALYALRVFELWHRGQRAAA